MFFHLGPSGGPPNGYWPPPPPPTGNGQGNNMRTYSELTRIDTWFNFLFEGPSGGPANRKLRGQSKLWMNKDSLQPVKKFKLTFNFV